MTLSQLRAKKIGVFGLGVEGESSAEFLLKAGAQVTIFDEREETSIDVTLAQRFKARGVRCVFGPGAFARTGGLDLIVRSPGIRRFRPELQEAEHQGITITSQTKLFFNLCPAEIVGVTGTKGKGTTSTLIYRMLQAAGMDAHLGGNIGQPPFAFLEKLTPSSKVVLELSSFQLEDLHTSPHIAVLLMMTSEHLAADTVGTANYHDSLDEYLNAKRRLVQFQTDQDYAVLNRDYPATLASKEGTKARVYEVSRRGVPVGDGCFVKDGVIWLRQEGREELVLAVDGVRLPGAHNLENVCAATMAATLAGAPLEAIREVLRTFAGLEHRLERVAEVNGVTYYDDSFSTTPETAIAAIQAFPAPKVLILGGSTKNSDFTELAQTIAASSSIRAIIGIGVEWARIKAALEQANTKTVPYIEGLTDMVAMVGAAADVAQPGDIVLLSPACASFGLFPNYKVRGALFRQEVLKLVETK